MRAIQLGFGVQGPIQARSLGAYAIDMRTKTIPMFPAGAGSLWTVWPAQATVYDGQSMYPDDGVWDREAGTHQGRY